MPKIGRYLKIHPFHNPQLWRTTMINVPVHTLDGTSRLECDRVTYHRQAFTCLVCPSRSAHPVVQGQCVSAAGSITVHDNRHPSIVFLAASTSSASAFVFPLTLPPLNDHDATMQSLPDAREQSFEELYGPPENFLEIEVCLTPFHSGEALKTPQSTIPCVSTLFFHLDTTSRTLGDPEI